MLKQIIAFNSYDHDCFDILQATKKKPVKGGSKKVAPAPLLKEKPKKVEKTKIINPLFEKRPRHFGIGKYYDVLYYSHSCDVNMNFFTWESNDSIRMYEDNRQLSLC